MVSKLLNTFGLPAIASLHFFLKLIMKEVAKSHVSNTYVLYRIINVQLALGHHGSNAPHGINCTLLSLLPHTLDGYNGTGVMSLYSKSKIHPIFPTRNTKRRFKLPESAATFHSHNVIN